MNLSRPGVGKLARGQSGHQVQSKSGFYASLWLKTNLETDENHISGPTNEAVLICLVRLLLCFDDRVSCNNLRYYLSGPLQDLPMPRLDQHLDFTGRTA